MRSRYFNYQTGLPEEFLDNILLFCIALDKNLI